MCYAREFFTQWASNSGLETTIKRERKIKIEGKVEIEREGENNIGSDIVVEAGPKEKENVSNCQHKAEHVRQPSRIVLRNLFFCFTEAVIKYLN